MEQLQWVREGEREFILGAEGVVGFLSIKERVIALHVASGGVKS